MFKREFERLLIENGKSLYVELSFRLFMHDMKNLVYVESGDLDLYVLKPLGEFSEYDDTFYTSLAEQNRLFLGELIAGPLYYLCNVTQGSLLFPFLFSPENKDFKVILKANSKSVLKKIPFEVVSGLIDQLPPFKEVYTDRIEEWISLLMYGFAKYPTRHGVIYLEAGINEIVKEKSQVVIPRHRYEVSQNLISWGKILEGSGNVVGLQEATIGAGSPILPLHPSLWIENRTPLKIEVYHANTEIPFYEQLEAITHFQNFVLAITKHSIQHVNEMEEVHLDLKRMTEELKLKGTLDSLGNLLKGRAVYKISDLGSHLLRACEVIGHTINRTVIAPLRMRGLDRSSQVYEICLASKLQARQVLLSGGWWKNSVSSILVFLLDSSNPERAALPNSKGGYTLVDPDFSVKKNYITQKIAETISLKGFLFYRSFPLNFKLSVQRILAFCTKHRMKNIFLIFASAFLANIVVLFIPFFNQILFDTVIPSSDSNLLYQLLFGLVIVAISGGCFTMTREYAILRLEILMTHDLEVAYWTKLLTLPLNFFRRFSVGDLYLRLCSIGSIRTAVAGSFSRVAINSIFSAVYLIPMFYFSVSLSILAVVTLTIVSALMCAMFLYGVSIQRQIREIGGVITGKILQIISGISKIRIYGVESRIFSYWGDSFAQMKILELKKGFIQNLSGTINKTAPTVIAMIVMSSVMYSYHPLTKDPNSALITLGNLMAFLSLFYTLTTTVLNLWETLINIMGVVPIWESSQPIVDETPEVIAEDPQDVQIKGKIELSHIYFRYSPDTPFIHKDINIRAEPGELIAIIGKAGCGKSTITKLLLGFEKPESGAIFFDGKDISSLDLQQLRGQIGVISQNSKVMDGTIRENITGGSVCTLEQVMQAVEMACFTEVLDLLPMGLHTYISHGCDTLSGGQLQRLFIARALVNSPKILILDEATNALDNTTQERVTRNIEYLNVTRIVIAHRLSTVRKADRIYVLDKGVIIESGNFEQLMALKGHFANLVNLQSLS